MTKTKNQLVLFDSQNKVLVCQGEWTLPNVECLEQEIKSIRWPTSQIVIDGKQIKKMDSAGAWILSNVIKKASKKDAKPILENISVQSQKLISLVESHHATDAKVPTRKKSYWVSQLGESTVRGFEVLQDYFTFIGQLTFEFLRLFRGRAHFRFSALVNVIDMTGLRALPIIALLSFMIGIVIAYQMGIQLKNYGANIFIVDFLGLSILREFGPLLTAIMVSGRTGSAFTAQLGIMKINQEIDALNTMGVTPGELLLLPRIIGLVIVLPLITMWANIFGVLGGMLMAQNMLGITPYDFVVRFDAVIPLKTLLLGLGKTPIFAMIISSIGCFEGMRVGGSADSVGQQTTRSVVLSIFFIIVADAVFSVIFSKMKL